nr:lymphocyte antigen 75-like [Misgurnus anguillicaudatus]
MKIVVFALLLSAHCELTTALIKQHFYSGTKSLTWTQAQSYCRVYYYDLSSLDSREEIAALSAISTSTLFILNPFIWVGLRLISANNWQWSNGANSSFIIWAPGEPNEPGGDICAAYKNGSLYDFPCTDSYSYYCYKWDPKLIVVKENKSWEDALQYCRTHHTDLASLPTKFHLMQAKEATADTSSVWTGLRFMARSWFWLSGESLGYVSAQLPACPAKNIYCGSLNLKAQSWEIRDCMEELNFVCY